MNFKGRHFLFVDRHSGHMENFRFAGTEVYSFAAATVTEDFGIWDEWSRCESRRSLNQFPFQRFGANAWEILR